MRKIDRDVSFAIRNGKNLKKGNTSVTFDGNICSVTLHNNRICYIATDCGQLRVIFDTCGYNTRTTISRLNACIHALGHPFFFYIQKGGICYGDRSCGDESVRKLEIFLSGDNPVYHTLKYSRQG